MNGQTSLLLSESVKENVHEFALVIISTIGHKIHWRSSISLLGAGHSTFFPAPSWLFQTGRRPGNNPVGRFYYPCFMRKLRPSEVVVFSVSHSWQASTQSLKSKFSNSSSTLYTILLNKLGLQS